MSVKRESVKVKESVINVCIGTCTYAGDALIKLVDNKVTQCVNIEVLF